MFTNYKYYTDNKSIVVAVSTYAGKKVKGIAKCASGDKFDLEKGKTLASARCNLKVANKRYKRAKKKYYESMAQIDKVDKHFRKMCEYLKDSEASMKHAEKMILEAESNL